MRHTYMYFYTKFFFLLTRYFFFISFLYFSCNPYKNACFHLFDREWKDGLLTSLLRKLCIQPASTNYDLQTTQKMKVIQLDGEVDPGQMELLSAVLNNDGAVVLGNNERIIIPETVRFIWEVSKLLTLISVIIVKSSNKFMPEKFAGGGKRGGGYLKILIFMSSCPSQFHICFHPFVKTKHQRLTQRLLMT